VINTAETVFEHLDGKDTWTISTDERTWKNRLVKLAEQNPAEVECVAVNRDGSVMYHVPASWVRLRPLVKRNLTDEQRAALADRIKSVRESMGI
jgi:hypothetical protein